MNTLIKIMNLIQKDINILIIDTAYTIIEIILGITIAIFIGIIIAILLDKNKKINNIILPIITISQTIPFVAISPIIIILIGYGIWSKIIVIIIYSFFTITINTLNSFQSIKQDELLMLKNMKIKNIYKDYKIPKAIPNIFSGIKIAITYSVGTAILAEYMGGNYGLGIYLSRSVSNFSLEGVIIVTIISTILILIFQKTIDKIKNKYFFKYYY